MGIADWMEIKTNTMAIITPKMNLLQMPIVDKFYVPPSDPAALTRNTDFAREKGLLSSRSNVNTANKNKQHAKQGVKHACC